MKTAKCESAVHNTPNAHWHAEVCSGSDTREGGLVDRGSVGIGDGGLGPPPSAQADRDYLTIHAGSLPWEDN